MIEALLSFLLGCLGTCAAAFTIMFAVAIGKVIY